MVGVGNVKHCIGGAVHMLTRSKSAFFTKQDTRIVTQQVPKSVQRLSPSDRCLPRCGSASSTAAARTAHCSVSSASTALPEALYIELITLLLARKLAETLVETPSQTCKTLSQKRETLSQTQSNACALTCGQCLGSCAASAAPSPWTEHPAHPTAQHCLPHRAGPTACGSSW